MAQNGGTRGRTFHGEIDRCGEMQAPYNGIICSRMPERDGKDQVEVTVTATSGANLLYPPGVWFSDVMTSFSGGGVTLFCLF